MSDADKRAVAEAIHLRRYKDHEVTGRLAFSGPNETRRLEALRLAKEAGVYPEYVRIACQYPVLRITVEEFE